MPSSEQPKPITDQQRIKALVILLLLASIVGQVFFLFFCKPYTYSPGQAAPVDFDLIDFQLCGMMASVGLFIVSSLILLIMRLEKNLALK